MKKYFYFVALVFALQVSFSKAQISSAREQIAVEHGGLSSARIATVDLLDTVIFDLSKTVISGSHVSFPVSFNSDDTINALDFSFKYNHSSLTYDSIQNLTTYIQPLAYYSTVDSTVRFTSYSFQAYTNSVSLVLVHFTMQGSQLNDTDLFSVNVYLNGNLCSLKLILPTPSGLEDVARNVDANCYPNPATGGRLYVQAREHSSIQLFTGDGTEILLENMSYSGRGFEIHTGNLATGFYTVRITSADHVITRKVLIQN